MPDRAVARSTFAREGQWYKGNLHCHSTLSDGHYTIEELMSAYGERGYRFLGLTEHNLFLSGEGMSRDDFLLLPGIEYNMRQEEWDYRCIHLNVFPGTDEMLARA